MSGAYNLLHVSISTSCNYISTTAGTFKNLKVVVGEILKINVHVFHFHVHIFTKIMMLYLY